MQKKIISMAIIGLMSAGAAFAQSNVTVYGRLDAGFSSWSADSVKNAAGVKLADSVRNNGVFSNGYTTSRLGFKGEEALGNGLKAIFQLETGISNDSKDGENTWGAGNTRQANVGLTGNFGTVKVGTQSSMSDLWHGDGVENMGNLSTRNVVGLIGGFANTKQPGLTYVSPSFSGLTFGVGAFFLDEGGDKAVLTYNDKTKNSNDSRTVYQIGGVYNNGPIYVASTYAVQDRDFGKSNKEFTLSGAYDFKVVKVWAGYEATKDISQAASPVGGAYARAGLYDFATWSLGVSVPVGAMGKVQVGYSQTDNDGKKNDSEAWLLGYEHNFSKRTTVYAAYQYLDNDKNATAQAQDRFHNGYGKGQFTRFAGRDYDGFSIGMKHMF